MARHDKLFLHNVTSSVLLSFTSLLLLLLSEPADARPKIIPKLGPCSSSVVSTIYIKNLNDLMSRPKLPKSQTVLMYLSNNITLASPITLDEAFSCTIIKADPALNGRMPFFYYGSNDNNTMLIVNVTNLMFIGIGFKHEWTQTNMWQCRPVATSTRAYRPPWLLNSDGFWDTLWTCGVVVIYRSFNVQITQGVVWGRLDIIRSASVEVSYSFLYADGEFDVDWNKLNAGYGWNWCTIRIMLCGDNVNLVRANNIIRNNNIRGAPTPVFLYWGAVGNIVQNNNITGYRFSGIQCGQGMRNVADCMLNTFELNYITPDFDPEKNITIHSDGAGIYYDLHWVNPGNRDSCNYLFNTYPRCYYIDYATSGLLVEGGVCIMNNGRAGGLYGNDTGVGGSSFGNYIKLNTGKFNVFKSVVFVHNGRSANLGIFSCQNWCFNRCGPRAISPEGYDWWDGYVTRYDNIMWRTNYPYMQTLCSAKGYTNNKVYYSCAPNVTVPNPGLPLPSCWHPPNMTQLANGNFISPSYEMSGNCSGWPVLNDIDIIFVTNFVSSSSWYGPLYKLDISTDCNPLGGTIPKLNNVNIAPPKLMPDSMGFNDEWGGDYGADDPSAPIYQRYPDFYSCPRRLVGPQTATFAKARSNSAGEDKFNRFRPSWLDKPPSPELVAQKPDLFEYVKKIMSRGPPTDDINVEVTNARKRRSAKK